MTQHENELHVAPWCEIIGPYNGLRSDDYYLYVKIGEKILSFRKESIEAEILQRYLPLCKLGNKIALLGTDDTSRPLLVRLVGREIQF